VYVFQPVDLTGGPGEGELADPRAGMQMISHFPMKPLFNNESDTNIGATTAVTRGVEITACPAFISEASNPWRK
jgi:hypothetical protein